jgi:IS605 OrfB family transposase
LSKVTIQTSIFRNQDNVAALCFLEEYAVIFGSAIRTGFSIRNKLGADTNKTKRQLESDISKQLELKYGLSSTDARNAYSKAEAIYASQVELVNLYIDERYESIKAVKKSIKKLEKQLVKAEKQWDELKIKQIKKKFHYKTNKIQSLQAKIVKLKEQRDSGRFSVTFGSSRLFDKHHRLGANGYKNHQEWLEDWRGVRNNRIYYEGAKLFIAGNQLCKFNPTEKTLTLTVPPCLVNKYGKTVTLYGVSFNYGQDWLSKALTPTKYPDGKPDDGKQKYRTGTLEPVTYELVNRDGRWYVNAIITDAVGTITTSAAAPNLDKVGKAPSTKIHDNKRKISKHGRVFLEKCAVPSTNNVVQILGSSKQGTAHFLEGCSGCPTLSTENPPQKGVLGIDFNPSSIDWTIVDAHGNLKRHGSIKINIQDKSSNQTSDILGKAIASIVRIAQKYQVPISIEDLDFRQKKAALKERSTKYARMLSNFAYSKFTQLIETRCSRQGVELNRVDPAYTSVIGVTKYMALYGLNSGCAAALVIARRGQGRTEKLPLGHARYFKRPEDRLKSGAWAKVSKKINICSGIARNEFYHLGDKKVKTNRLLHGKLRQIRSTKWSGQTVQVLRTPHIKVSVEVGAAFRHDPGKAELAILGTWRESAQFYLPTDLQPPPWVESAAGQQIQASLRVWAEASPRPLVIFIDEIDALQDEALISVLRQLRNGFPTRPKSFPQSVGLIGLRDVRDYKVAAGGSERLNTASPFNIKVRSLTLRDFNALEVAELYHQHTQETGQEFTDEAVQTAFDLTQGQPWLVNALAKEVVEELITNTAIAITEKHIQEAKEILIRRQDTHLDSLAERLRESRVKAIIEPMLAGQELGDIPNDDIQFVLDIGLCRIDPLGGLAIANPIYREVLPRVLTVTPMASLPQIAPTWLTEQGELNTEELLQAFLTFWLQHGEPLLGSTSYHEIAPHLVLMAFLHRVVNGGGTLEREYAIGRDRMDLCLHYGKTTLGIELKVWRDKKGDPVAAGLEQLDAYLARLGLDSGWLVIFDCRHSALPIEERLATQLAITNNGRTVTVVRA